MNLIQQQLQKFKQQKTVLALLIFTFIIILFWTVLSILESQRTVIVEKELIELSKPLTPRLDQEIFTTIEQKNWYQSQDLKEFEIYTLKENEQGGFRLGVVGEESEPTPSPTPTISQSSAQAQEASPSAAATPSAQTGEI